MSDSRQGDAPDDGLDEPLDDSRAAREKRAREAGHADDDGPAHDASGHEPLNREQNPPRTTKGWFTAPKFGSASSGGGEFEPGPEKD